MDLKRMFRLKGCSREVLIVTREVTREVYVKLADNVQNCQNSYKEKEKLD